MNNATLSQLYINERIQFSRYIAAMNLRHTFSLKYSIKHERTDSGRKYTRVFCDVSQVHVRYDDRLECVTEVNILLAVVEISNVGVDHRPDEVWESGNVCDSEVFITHAPYVYFADRY